MDTETEIRARYELELALIGSLDREYYSKPAPTSAERAKYQKRQEQLETLRAQFYTERDRLSRK